MSTSTEEHRKLVDKKLRSRLRIYLLLSVIFAVAILYEILSGRVSVLIALACLVVGFMLGTAIARMYRLSWDEGAQKVISTMDTIGAIILVVYLVFTIFLKNKILGNIVQANYVSGAGLSLTAGIMWGRLVGMTHNLVQILRKYIL